MKSWQVSSLILLALALVSAACGGSGDDTRPATATATSEATPVLEGAARDLFDLLAGGLAATYRLTYQTSSPEGEEGDRYVIAYQAPLARIETYPAGSQTASSILIGGDVETETINCTSSAGAWRCEEIDPLGESLLRAAGPIIFFDASDIGNATVTEAGQRTLAGQEARCFVVTEEAAGEEPAEFCFTSDGIPLYTKTAIGIVEATDFSREVADDDFEPPAAPG